MFNLAQDIRLPVSLVNNKKIGSTHTPGLNVDGSANSYDVSVLDWINYNIEQGYIDVTGSAGAAVTIDQTQTITGAKTFSAVVTANAGVAGGASADITLNTNKFTVDATNGDTVVAGTLAVGGATVTLSALPEYADDTAAGVGGLTAGMVYQTATGELRIKL